MYRCYHLKSKVSKKTLGFLFRCYTTYAGCTLILIFFVTIAYDWRTGMGENTILANGHCSFVDPSSYNTLLFTNFIVYCFHQQISSNCNVFNLSCVPLQVQPKCSCCTGHSAIQS